MAALSTGEVYIGYTEEARLWDFYLSSYEAPLTVYANNYLIRNEKESDTEYNNRIEGSHRKNNCKYIVNLLNAYLFKDKPSRIAHDEISKKLFGRFEKDADGKGTNLNQFMRRVDRYASALGRVYVVMDRKNLPDGEKTGTHRDNLMSKHYAYMVYPQQVKKVAFDDFENIKWCVIEEAYYNDDDPFDSESLIKQYRYRLWTDNEWYLFNDDDLSEPVESGKHNLGICPCFYVDGEDGVSRYNGQSLIGDISYIDKALFNNESRLNQIIEDQTFSQLCMPVQSVVYGEESGVDEAIEMSTKRVLLFDTSGGKYAAPVYISPDASQAEFILNYITKLTVQLYNSIGLQSEVGESANSESGKAKAYDYSRLNSILCSRAERLETVEEKLLYCLSRWTDEKLHVEIKYPDDFDIRTLQNEIQYAQELALLRISDTFQKQIHKRVAKKALPKVSNKVWEDISHEIDISDPLIPTDVLFAEEKLVANGDDNNSNENHQDRLKKGKKGGNLRKDQTKVDNL